jgi:uncharacterized protein (TIGR03067 family)
MKTCLFALSLVGLLLIATGTTAAEEAKEKAIQQDREKIEGKWRIIRLDINGNKAAEDDIGKLTVVNGNDGTWTLFDDGKEISKGTSTFDPTQKPKAIDFTPTAGGGAGEHYRGIYELGEDSRKLCFAPPGHNRPAEFSSPPGSEHILVTFERVKAKP